MHWNRVQEPSIIHIISPNTLTIGQWTMTIMLKPGSIFNANRFDAMHLNIIMDSNIFIFFSFNQIPNTIILRHQNAK